MYANTASTTEQEAARQIKQLLQESKNSLVDDRADAARLDELRRLLAQWWPSAVVSNQTSTPAQQTWRRFLRQAQTKLLHQLSKRIQQGKRTAVRTFWGVVASSPQYCLAGHQFGEDRGMVPLLDETLVREWVRAMTHIPIWDQSIQRMVRAEFLQPYHDVQYQVMKSIHKIAEQVYQEELEQQNKKRKGDSSAADTSTSSLAAERLLQMLIMIPLVNSQAELNVTDTSSGSAAYLFAPPQPSHLKKEAKDSDSDQSSDDEGDSNDEDEDDVDDDVSSSSDEEEEEDQVASPRPLKKRRATGFPIQTLSCHRREWSKAWWAVLRLSSLPPQCLKQALVFLPQHVLPVVSRPLLFADFFMNAYSTSTETNEKSSKKVNSATNQSSIVPILALDGLFYLMVEHGLEYPKYYMQLYQLITPTLLSIKHKARFLDLLDKSVSRNELLPAHIVAAMGKRLLQCALAGAPPSSILWALALISNWFRKHPETNCLLHRTAVDPIQDKFDKHASDPGQANALQSSLWELHALSNHYYPAVATLAASLGTVEESKLPLYQARQDFGQLSYHSLLEQERKRKPRPSSNSKNAKSGFLTPLTFAPPKHGLFGDEGEGDSSKKSVLGSILARPSKRVKAD